MIKSSAYRGATTILSKILRSVKYVNDTITTDARSETASGLHLEDKAGGSKIQFYQSKLVSRYKQLTRGPRTSGDPMYNDFRH